jgi:hypothetical protein
MTFSTLDRCQAPVAIIDAVNLEVAAFRDALRLGAQRSSARTDTKGRSILYHASCLRPTCCDFKSWADSGQSYSGYSEVPQ